MLIGDYLPGDVINASWLAMFGFVTRAAAERAWIARYPSAGATHRVLLRERWVEAVVPALLLIIMVIVAVAGSATFTPRVIAIAAGLTILFAVILGVREAWIQKESQELTSELIREVDPVTLHIDADGLALALRNLLENALKYTREIETPCIEVRAVRNDDGVVLSLRDNGIGFDMQYHDHIFKVFQRLHRDERYPGTGIGLALVRKAMERIGGSVWAQSEPGNGATFYLELPADAVVRERQVESVDCGL